MPDLVVRWSITVNAMTVPSNANRLVTTANMTNLRLIERSRNDFTRPLPLTATSLESDDRTSTDRKFWLGSMTPKETARLLESIERGTAASKASCDAMLRTLRRQQLGARRLPHFIDVPVGHKTGDGGTIANDVGVVYAKSGPIVVAFFATQRIGAIWASAPMTVSTTRYPVRARAATGAGILGLRIEPLGAVTVMQR